MLSFSAFSEKYALIIALGTYNKETGWSSISSANDVEIMKQALIVQGFSEKNIIVYIDGLDKEGILRAIEKDLIGRVKEGDVAYFHFSGHGQQIADDNGDELDGLDEALVPIDAPMKNRLFNRTTGQYEDYNGEKHLRDDELGEILDRLRIKLGSSGNVMVVIDACHSGTATRGIGKARGTDQPNVPDGWTPPKSFSRGETNDGGFGLIDTDPGKAGMVCFFGSSQDELNYEYQDENDRGYGSLSFALSQAFSEATPNTSYRVLFENVKTKMSAFAPKQTPQSEGVIDQEILGGKLLGKPEYLTAIKWEDDTHLTLNAGKLQSLNEGSIVVFYPPDTRDVENVQELAVGKVVSARWGDANIELTNGKLDKKTALSSWCFVRERSFGERIIKIQVKASDSKDVLAVKQALKSYPLLKVTEESGVDLLLEINGKGDSRGAELIVTTMLDDVIFKKPLNYQGEAINNKDIQEALIPIMSYCQARFLRETSLDNPEMKAEVLIVPLKIREGANSNDLKNENFEELDPESLKDRNGNIIVPEGTYIRLKIRNLSTRKMYYTLIDIFPDNNLSVLYPHPRRSPAEYSVEGGRESDKTAVFQIGPPYGNDVLKLIVSETPINLSSVVSTRGESRGDGSHLELLFQNSFNSTRGPKNVELNIENLGIYTTYYKIVPKDEMLE